MKPNMLDSSNVEELFRKYKDKIYRLALSISRNKKDAEDILQNTFLKVIKNLVNFKGESHLSTWIYKIAYNEALMVLRKRKKQFKLSDSLAKAERSGLFINWSKLPDKQLLDNELKERLDSAIGDISIKYRMPLLLHNVEGLSIKDSAEVLGLKEESLKTRLHRARLMIRSEILNYFKDQQEIKKIQDSRCGIWLGFIYDYAGGYLDKKREAAFNRHIEDCPKCNSFLDTYLKAIRITKTLQCQDLPPGFQQKIETFLSKNK